MLAGVAASEPRPLLVASHERPPFHFSSVNGEIQGLCIDIIDQIFGELNTTYRVINVPWVRVWEMVKKGEVDAALSVSRKPTREQYVMYPETDMWVSEFVFFRNSASKKLVDGSLASIRSSGSSIAIERGASYFDSFWAVYPYRNGYSVYSPKNMSYHANLWDAISVTQSFKMLAEKRVDLVLADRRVGKYKLKQLNIRNIVSYDDILHSKGYPMPFVIGSNYPGLTVIHQKFEEKLKALKTNGTYQKIENKWLK